MTAESQDLIFHAVREDRPGQRWNSLFSEFWPDYQAWFLREGEAARPTRAECEAALREHMPELGPIYEELVRSVGGGDHEARMLSLYCPTPYLGACSQIALTEPEPVLLRNYDYSPQLCEGVLTRSAWFGRRVLGMADCIWGLLDGMNDAGLAASLAFGGRRALGKGFGVPLVVRYVLEICDKVSTAITVLKRIPVHMAYNVTLVDRRGSFATVYLAPDRPALVRRTPIATNHQRRVEWPEYDALTASRERELRLGKCLLEGRSDPDQLTAELLSSPSYRTSYRHRSGTLYTAVYRPQSGEVDVVWPGAVWQRSFEDFEEASLIVRYTEGVGARAGVQGNLRQPG